MIFQVKPGFLASTVNCQLSTVEESWFLGAELRWNICGKLTLSVKAAPATLYPRQVGVNQANSEKSANFCETGFLKTPIWPFTSAYLLCCITFAKL